MKIVLFVLLLTTIAAPGRYVKEYYQFLVSTPVLRMVYQVTEHITENDNCYTLVWKGIEGFPVFGIYPELGYQVWEFTDSCGVYKKKRVK